MEFDKICRICLAEKLNLKPIFGAGIPNMLMTCASVQILEGDGLPHQICTQCLQMVNRSYQFKEQCEKSDATLRDYITKTALQNEQNLLNEVKNNQLFPSDVLSQTSIFNEIFNDDNTHSLVDNFEAQNSNTVVPDLAETMESLQSIAEQCLQDSWDAEASSVTQHCSNDASCSKLNLINLYKCQFCEGTFKDEWNLADHMKVHTGQSKYFCTICGKGCNNSTELNMHISMHSAESTVILQKQKIIKEIICNVCGKSFENVTFLRKHFKDQHSKNAEVEKRHTCNICGNRYRYNKSLVLHMRTHTGEKPLSCEVCGKTFSLPSSLHKHRNIHTGLKKYKCNICDKAFSQAANAAAHIKTHTGEKSFVCNICGKACASKANLNIHLRIHSGERPYGCKHCDKKFSTSSQLNKHMLHHTGERPYECWQCGKWFRQKDARDTHMRYHTGERPFACQLCAKTYIAASHLRAHVKTHTNDRKYQCNICMKKFFENRTLKAHILSHSGKKPQCTFCGRKFAHSGSLKNHLKANHT